jgi:hypothetical protein
MWELAESWVVYLMTIRQRPEGMMAVCNQAEWDSMELARPGYNKLIQGGIRSEREAELLARGTSGDALKRFSKSH